MPKDITQRITAVIIIVSLILTISSLYYTQTVKAQSLADKLIELINQYRVANGLKPLKVSKELTLAAQRHSEDMANRNYFSHYTPEGLSPVDRVVAAGYTNWVAVGENIAAGFLTPEDVFNAWKKSPGHREVMLNRYFEEIGVGIATNPNSYYKIYWTADFGARKSGSQFGGGSSYKPPSHKSYKSYSYTPRKKPLPITAMKIEKRDNFKVNRMILIKTVQNKNITISIYDNSTGHKLYQLRVKTNETGYALVPINLNYTGTLRIVVSYKGDDKYEKSIKTLFIQSRRYYKLQFEGSILINGSWLNNSILIVEEGSVLKIEAPPGFYEYKGIGILKVFYCWNDGELKNSRILEVRKAQYIRPIYTVVKSKYIPV
ncbi:MAG: CAP domain-containing protein [Thermoproteales archaeon]|nr:CAP domain-containing protein [Thermoproteales archaeon]